MAKILLVDDDSDHNRALTIFLRREHHLVEVATTGDRAMQLLNASLYDIVILDWALPDMTGIDLIKWYRKAGSSPIIMLTGKGTISDRETGLDCGADDYLIKPFSARELAARIRAVLRRPANVRSTVLAAGDYSLNPADLTATRRGGEVIQLRPLDFALLEFFCRNPGQIFEAEALLARVWGSESETSPDSVRQTIKRLRDKLGEKLIETIPGAGYKLGE